MVQQLKLIAVLLIVFLSACGPGTGGTGTGPILSSADPSTNSPTSSVAPTPNPLGTSSATTQLTTQPTTQPTTQILDTWISDDLKTLLIRESNRITISTACANYEFSGPTALDGTQLTLFSFPVGGRLEITLLETKQLNFLITNSFTGAVELQGRLNNTPSQVTSPLGPCAP
jgi:hypothetical protein